MIVSYPVAFGEKHNTEGLVAAACDLLAEDSHSIEVHPPHSVDKNTCCCSLDWEDLEVDHHLEHLHPDSSCVGVELDLPEMAKVTIKF